MKTRRQLIRLPAITAAGSFLCLLLVALLTSPVRDVGFSVVFFLAVLVFLISLGYIAVYIQTGSMQPKHRFRIFIISLFIMLLLLFRSAGSLSLIDALILLLIISGLLFYSNRRAS